MRALRYIFAVLSLLGIIGTIGRIGSNENQAGVFGVLFFWLFVLIVSVFGNKQLGSKPEIDSKPTKQHSSIITVTVGVIVGIGALVALGFIYDFVTADNTPQPVLATESVQVPVVEEKPLEIKLYTPQELLDITNTIRIENSVPSLALDENLNLSASLKLEEMTKDGVFEHLSASGKRGVEYINDLNIPCYFVGENLQRVTPYVKQIKDFEGSEGHWDAVNNPDYESVGFAMNQRYFVMHFCDKDPN